MDDRSLQFHMEPKSYGMNDSESHNAGPFIYRKLPGTPGTGQLFIYFLDIFIFFHNNKQKKRWLPRHLSHGC